LKYQLEAETARVHTHVKIPKSLIEKLKPFGARFIKVAPPEQDNAKSGKQAVEKGFAENPYEAKDLRSWLDSGGNYGVLLGNGVIGVDLDEKKLQKLFEEKVSTFTVKSGRGKHYYIRSDVQENGVLLDEDKKNLGNIQVQRKFLVGAGSTHNTGRKYEIVNDVPFALVPKKHLEEIFGSYLQWSRQKLSQKQAAQEVKKIQKFGLDTNILETLDVTELKEIAPYEYQGAHPIHGSTTGINFTVNSEKNCWHCFRCNSGGGILSWMLVKNGTLECHQAQKGTIKGDLLKTSLELTKEEIKKIQYRKDRENLLPLSYTEWLAVVESQFGKEILPLAKGAANVIAQLKIKDISLPFVLIFCDVPSTLKTTVIRFFEDLTEYVYKTSHFTAASFVSHSAKSKKKDLKNIDLLPKIKGKLVLTPDMSTFFSRPEETLKSELGVFTEICDGRGYGRDSGVHGHRGYKGNYNFMMLAATTPVPYHVWKIMGILGHRIHFLNGNVKDPTDKELTNMLKGEDIEKKMEICKEATARFVRAWLKPEEKIFWNREKDNTEAQTKIGKFARLLCQLRGILNMYVSEEPNPLTGEVRREAKFSRPIIEKPTRISWRLYNYARANAVNNERTRLEMEDVESLIPIVLSSAPEDRLMAFRYLLHKNGECTRTDLVQDLKMSKTNAYRCMTILEHLNLVTVEKEQTNTLGGTQFANKMKLKKRLLWLLKEPLPPMIIHSQKATSTLEGSSWTYR